MIGKFQDARASSHLDGKVISKKKEFLNGTCGRCYWAHLWMILCMISDIDYVLNCFV